MMDSSNTVPFIQYIAYVSIHQYIEYVSKLEAACFNSQCAFQKMEKKRKMKVWEFN